MSGEGHLADTWMPSLTLSRNRTPSPRRPGPVRRPVFPAAATLIPSKPPGAHGKHTHLAAARAGHSPRRLARKPSRHRHSGRSRRAQQPAIRPSHWWAGRPAPYPRQPAATRLAIRKDWICQGSGRYLVKRFRLARIGHWAADLGGRRSFSRSLWQWLILVTVRIL